MRFFYALAVFLFTILSVDAGAYHCPNAVAPPTLSSRITNGKTIASRTLSLLLADAPYNVEEPEDGRVYAFLGFVQSNFFWESWCNGGKHVYLILAAWDSTQRSREKQFEAYQADLIVEEAPPRACGELVGDLIYSRVADFVLEEVYDTAAAYWKIPGRYKFQVLGKVGSTESIGEINEMITTSANAFFQQNNKYNYLWRNCGTFVRMLENVLRAEYGITTTPC